MIYSHCDEVITCILSFKVKLIRADVEQHQLDFEIYDPNAPKHNNRDRNHHGRNFKRSYSRNRNNRNSRGKNNRFTIRKRNQDQKSSKNR